MNVVVLINASTFESERRIFKMFVERFGADREFYKRIPGQLPSDTIFTFPIFAKGEMSAEGYVEFNIDKINPYYHDDQETLEYELTFIQCDFMDQALLFDQLEKEWKGSLDEAIR